MSGVGFGVVCGAWRVLFFGGCLFYFPNTFVSASWIVPEKMSIGIGSVGCWLVSRMYWDMRMCHFGLHVVRTSTMLSSVVSCWIWGP